MPNPEAVNTEESGHTDRGRGGESDRGIDIHGNLLRQNQRGALEDHLSESRDQLTPDPVTGIFPVARE